MSSNPGSFAIAAFRDAEAFLQNFYYNDPEYKEILEDLKLQKERPKITKQTGVCEQITQIISSSYSKLMIHEKDELFNRKLKLSLECLVCTTLHVQIMGNLREANSREDKHLFTKSNELNEQNVTTQQLGGARKYLICIHAAVVELSNLDAYRNPLEKYHCFQTALDLIYAQLKAEIAEIGTSDAAVIPVIENEDVLTILMMVIGKSKLRYLYSNLVYVQDLTSRFCKNDDNYCKVMETFCIATERISSLDIQSLQVDHCKVDKDLHYLTAMKMICDNTVDDDLAKNYPFLNYHRERTKRLILSSTEI